MTPVVKEKPKLKLALAIPTGPPIILEKVTIDIPPLIADKTIKALSKSSKAVMYSFSPLVTVSVSRIL